MVAGYGPGVPGEWLRCSAAKRRRCQGFTPRRVRRGRIHRRGCVAGEGHRRARALLGVTLMALPSSGLHTNGYSLARAIAFDRLTLRDRQVAELGETVGEALLRPIGRIAGGRSAASTGVDQGHGAHHRRRSHRECAAHVARGSDAFSIDQSWTVPPLFPGSSGSGSA